MKNNTLGFKISALRLTACIILTTLFSCYEKGEGLSEEMKAKVITDVGQMLYQYVAAIKERGLIAEFDFLDHSAEFFWVPPGYDNPLSYDSVAAVLKVNAGRFNSVDISFDSITILPLRDNLAAYTAVLTSVMMDVTSGKFSSKLIETGLVIKRETGWKLLCGQTAVIPPK